MNNNYNEECCFILKLGSCENIYGIYKDLKSIKLEKK